MVPLIAGLPEQLQIRIDWLIYRGYPRDYQPLIIHLQCEGLTQLTITDNVIAGRQSLNLEGKALFKADNGHRAGDIPPWPLGDNLNCKGIPIPRCADVMDLRASIRQVAR